MMKIVVLTNISNLQRNSLKNNKLLHKIYKLPLHLLFINHSSNPQSSVVLGVSLKHRGIMPRALAWEVNKNPKVKCRLKEISINQLKEMMLLKMKLKLKVLMILNYKCQTSIHQERSWPLNS